MHKHAKTTLYVDPQLGVVEVIVILSPTVDSLEWRDHARSVHVCIVPIDDKSRLEESGHLHLFPQLTLQPHSEVRARTRMLAMHIQESPLVVTDCL